MSRHEQLEIAARKMAKCIEFDTSGENGKGGNGGLASDATTRAKDEYLFIANRAQHPDDLAVDRWAEAMKEKLAKKRRDGRSGWEDKQQCTQQQLSAMLISHVRKGDPLDVANLAMMLHQRGERIELDDAAEFEAADFYWRTMDPDDSGDCPGEPNQRAGLGHYCVAEIACSFTGPRRFGFNAPTLDPDSDDEEFLHFATQAEALQAAKTRKDAITAQDTLFQGKVTTDKEAAERADADTANATNLHSWGGPARSRCDKCGRTYNGFDRKDPCPGPAADSDWED